MKVVRADIADWVAHRIPECERGFGACRTLAVMSDGEIIAGVVFHNWNPEAGVIEISSAATSPRWFQRGVMETILNYPFNECDCQMVVARMATTNTRARRLWKALGADEIILPRMRGREMNEALQTLTAEAWDGSKLRRQSHG